MVQRRTSLRHDSILNLLGHGLPAVLGIVALPFLIHGLGTSRFGVLSLVWVIVAYFSLVDLGVGRALTHRISDALAAGREGDVAPIAAAGVGFMLAMGAVGAAAAFLLAPALVGALRLPPELAAEAVRAFRILAAALPFIVSAQGVQAVLVAYGRFDLVNLIRVPAVSLGYLLPLAAVAVSPTLAAVTAATAAAHCAGWLAYVAVCLRVVPALRRPARPEAGELRRLLGYGGWLTVSNVVAPLMLYIDRFLIARMVSAAGVAWYTTPFGVVTQLWIVPRAVTEALFQRLVGELATDRGSARATYRRGLLYVVGILAPVALVVVLLARPALSLWVGQEFAAASYRVAQILVVAVLINSVGLVATALIQAAGRPDITAKLHVVEAPLYFTYLVLLLGSYGIIGAAVAWLIRVSISACVLSIIAQRMLAGARIRPQQPDSAAASPVPVGAAAGVV